MCAAPQPHTSPVDFMTLLREKIEPTSFVVGFRISNCDETQNANMNDTDSKKVRESASFKVMAMKLMRQQYHYHIGQHQQIR
jgi:hypothetical protein